MKLEAGMYVRTKEGIIGKYNVIKEFENVPTFNGFYETKETEREYIDDKPFRNYDIKKASFNLIDLLEVGDYVNGEIVKEVYIADELNEKDSCFIEILEEYLCVDDIKEVLTHEQYEANAYKLGGE